MGSLRDISPDGSSLLLSVFNPERRVSDAWIQPRPRGPARLLLKDARWPRWTPDGKSILFARNTDHDLYRVNANGIDARHLATFPDITGLEISPDGRRIRFAVEPKDDLWEADTDGSGSHALSPEFRVSGPAFGNWSPDGKYFFAALSGGDRDDLWVLSEGRRRWWQRGTTSPTQLTFGPMSMRAPTISKDGRQLFAVALERHGELSVYDNKSDRFLPYLNGIQACYVDFFER
jgi:Tol biopolymer transport system component